MKKGLIAAGVLFLATGVTAMAMSGKINSKISEAISAKYPKYKIYPVPESSNVYLLVGSEDVIIIAKNENLFSGVKFREVVKAPLESKNIPQPVDEEE